MTDNDSVKSAVGNFVESLEEEHKSDKLLEDNSKKKGYKQSDGFFKLVSKLKRIIEMTCLGEEARIETDEKNYLISVYGKELSAMIGKDGQVIEALEKIINLFGKRKELIDKRIVLDINDYRKNNIAGIEKMAMQMAEKAVSEGKKITLQPMPSYERKIVHSLLAKIKDVKTHSRYDEPHRRIIIYPVNENKT